MSALFGRLGQRRFGDNRLHERTRSLGADVGRHLRGDYPANARTKRHLVVGVNLVMRQSMAVRQCLDVVK